MVGITNVARSLNQFIPLFFRVSFYPKYRARRSFGFLLRIDHGPVLQPPKFAAVDFDRGLVLVGDVTALVALLSVGSF